MREFLRILRRRKRVLIYTVAVLVAFVVGLSLAQTPVYSAQTTVLIPTDVRGSVDQTRPTFSSSDLLNRALTNEIAFAQGDRVRAAVVKRLGHIPKVVITPVADTDTLAFAAESTDPARAASDANEYADAYLQERRATRTADYLNTADTLVNEIRSLRNRQNDLARDDPQVPGSGHRLRACSSPWATFEQAGNSRRWAEASSERRASRSRQFRRTLRETGFWPVCSVWSSA